MQDSEAVSAFMSSVIQAFLVRHGFAKEMHGRQRQMGATGAKGGKWSSPSPRKKRRLDPRQDHDLAISPSRSPARTVEERQHATPLIACQNNESNEPGHLLWTDPRTNIRYAVDKRTGNSYPLGMHDEGGNSHDIDEPFTQRPTSAHTRRTIGIRRQDGEGDTPRWIQKALTVRYVLLFNCLVFRKRQGYPDPCGARFYRQTKRTPSPNARSPRSLRLPCLPPLTPDTLLRNLNLAPGLVTTPPRTRNGRT